MEVTDDTKLQLKRANFCRGRLCLMCNWCRSLMLKNRYRAAAHADPDCAERDRGLIRPIDRQLTGELWAPHGAPALEIGRDPSVPRARGQSQPRWHVSPALSRTVNRTNQIFGAGSPFYIGQAEWRVMCAQCLRADGRRIVDIRVTEKPSEVAKNTLASPTPI